MGYEFICEFTTCIVDDQYKLYNSLFSKIYSYSYDITMICVWYTTIGINIISWSSLLPSCDEFTNNIHIYKNN